MANLQEWQVPPAASDSVRKLNWTTESIEEGLAWHKSQRGTKDIKQAIEILAGRHLGDQSSEYRSKLVTGRLKRNTKEVIGACANIRPIWAYNSDNAAYASQCSMMNKLTRAVYLENFLDLGIKRALQWSASTCTGFLNPVYRRDMGGHGKGNLCFDAYGSPSVLPNQLPSDNDWQQAYVVHLLKEVPIYQAHGMFPRFQEQLRPTSSRFWHAPEIREATKGNLLQRIFGGGFRKSNNSLSDLYIGLRYSYINDLSINDSSVSIPMGQPDASWFYEVPHIGMEIPSGRTRDGQVTFRKATEEDARLYPYRRLIISTDDLVLYDGPAFDWHGQLPLIPFTLDDWAWEALGFSIMKDGMPLQSAINEIERGTMDKIRSGLDMALAYDINAVARDEANKFDPMQPRGRVGFDGALTDQPFKQVMPDSVLQIDKTSLEFKSGLEDTMDYQMAINSIQALAKARALGGGAGDTEKILEADGPIVRDISRNVERGIARAGDQTKYILLQYYNTSRVLQYVGVNGMTMNVSDFKPRTLVPSHMPDEYPMTNGVQGQPDTASVFTDLQRARFFADNLRFFLLPHSVHEITQMSYKLGLIQLKNAGVPISSKLLAEAWDFDLGGTWTGRDNYEWFYEEMEDAAQHAIRVKQIVDAITAQGVEPTPAMLAAIAGALGDNKREGRPPTMAQSPQLNSKDGGARSTISTSGS